MSRVLLVEDEPLIAMMLEDKLLDLGHEIVGVASTIVEGLRSLDHTQPDFAVVDFQLADGACHELISALLARGIAFVLVTGSQIAPSDRCILGIEVLSKPIDMDLLASAISRFATHRKTLPMPTPRVAAVLQMADM